MIGDPETEQVLAEFDFLVDENKSDVSDNDSLSKESLKEQGTNRASKRLKYKNKASMTIIRLGLKYASRPQYVNEDKSCDFRQIKTMIGAYIHFGAPYFKD